MKDLLKFLEDPSNLIDLIVFVLVAYLAVFFAGKLVAPVWTALGTRLRKWNINLPWFKLEGDSQGDTTQGEIDKSAQQAVNLSAIYLLGSVEYRRVEAMNLAWARQLEIAEDASDEFWAIFRKVTDPWQVGLAWSRFHSLLASIANRNHILGLVTDGVIRPGYLDEKVLAFGLRYEKLLTWPKAKLPPFADIEPEIRHLIQRVVMHYATTAIEERRRFLDFAESQKMSSPDPLLQSLIDKMIEASKEAHNS